MSDALDVLLYSAGFAVWAFTIFGLIVLVGILLSGWDRRD